VPVFGFDVVGMQQRGERDTCIGALASAMARIGLLRPRPFASASNIVPAPLPSAFKAASNGCQPSLTGGRAPMEKMPSTVARSQPERTTSTPILPPSRVLTASMMIDLPAPVSPVKHIEHAVQAQMQAINNGKVSDV